MTPNGVNSLFLIANSLQLLADGGPAETLVLSSQFTVSMLCASWYTFAISRCLAEQALFCPICCSLYIHLSARMLSRADAV